MAPKIDRAKCRNCGACMFQCGKHVFAMDAVRSRVAVRRAKDCVNCFICELYCRTGAVSVKIAKAGVVSDASGD